MTFKRQTLARVYAAKFLTKNERVEEIARILGGAKVTENTRIHASELISLAND